MNTPKDVGIYWNDIRAYHNGGLYTPSIMYTEGVLQKRTKKYILVRDPETLDVTQPSNHPHEKPLFYFIPTSLIIDIIYYEYEN